MKITMVSVRNPLTEGHQGLGCLRARESAQDVVFSLEARSVRQHSVSGRAPGGVPRKSGESQLTAIPGSRYDGLRAKGRPGDRRRQGSPEESPRSTEHGAG